MRWLVSYNNTYNHLIDLIPNNNLYLFYSNDHFEIYIDNNLDKNGYSVFEDDERICFTAGYACGLFRISLSEKICDEYKTNGVDGLYSINGEWNTVILNKTDHSVVAVSDREGILPFYYRYDEKGIIITTEQQYLLYDYCINDIDIASVYDFVRYGTLIGNHTFSKKVKLLEGGTVLEYNGKIKTQRHYLFTYHSGKSNVSLEKLIDDLYESYCEGVKKRLRYPVDDCVLFLSGGIDSRFLLSAINSITDDRILCYSFGQPYCEEVELSKRVAELKNNPFLFKYLHPIDFLKNVESYAEMTGGSDMVTQGYIIDTSLFSEKKCFMSGFCLDAQLGTTFIDESSLSTRMGMRDYALSHLGLGKMELISEKLFNELAKENVFSDEDRSSIIEALEPYTCYEAVNAFQPFAVNQRAKRLVLQRDVIPAKKMNYINPNFDKDFLEIVARIPAEYRLNHVLYRQMMIDKASKYSALPYNNTTVPISAPHSIWRAGAELERKKEQLWEEVMKDLYEHGRELHYYPHYYSDFNGYSRYDGDWLSFIDKWLCKENSVLCECFFKKESIQKLLELHRSGKANYRRLIVYLFSLEVFFSTAIKDK